MDKRKDTLWISALLALVLCVVLLIGGTYALFTGNVEVNNHLSAGNLKVGLTRVSYKEHNLDERGVLTDKIDDTVIDLTQDGKEIFTVDKAVPTSWYEATIEVSNLGSAAFDYGMRILWTDMQVDDEKYDETLHKNDEILAAQIQITVTSSKIADADADGQDENGTNYVQFMLDKCADPENDISLGYLLKNEGTNSFTVKAEFLNNEVNNAAMLASLTFDVQVFATQKTSVEADA